MAERVLGDRPLVSVVTVCYNSERHLSEAMGSVLKQTYPEIEYIVIDGGSTDGTLGIIRSYEERFGDALTWISEPDSGIYDAMNKGIARASGQLVGLLNSDDAYVLDAVERIVAAYRDRPDAGAFYGDVDIVGETGALVRTEVATVPPDGELPQRMPMCHQSLFVARHVYEELGPFDTSFRILADYEHVLRLRAAGVRFVHVDGAIARFRLGGACSADTAKSAAEREAIRVRYGASPLVERLKRLRHAVNRAGYAALSRVAPGMAARHEGSRRRA